MYWREPCRMHGLRKLQDKSGQIFVFDDVLQAALHERIRDFDIFLGQLGRFKENVFNQFRYNRMQATH